MKISATSFARHIVDAAKESYGFRLITSGLRFWATNGSRLCL